VNRKNILIYGLLYAGLICGQAFADWQGAGSGSSIITFDAVTNGSKQIPKHVNVDSTGTPVGTSSNPIQVNPVSAGNAATVTAGGALTANIAQINGSAVSVSNALPVTPTVGSATVSASNPVPLQLSQGGVAVSGTNPLPSQLVVSGSPVSSGNPLPVVSSQSEPVTYSASGITTYATNATDVIVLQGTASKVVKIKRVGLTIGSAGSVYASVMRRSSSFSGGTCASSTSSIMKHDTADASPSLGNLWICTANPTVGSLVGRLRSVYIGVSGSTVIEWELGNVSDKAIVLRGASDYLTINLEGSNVSNTLLWFVEWTEE